VEKRYLLSSTQLSVITGALNRAAVARATAETTTRHVRAVEQLLRDFHQVPSTITALEIDDQTSELVVILPDQPTLPDLKPTVA
jgi:hypothetical protein